MTDLTVDERAFIDYMQREPSQIDYGYSLILKKSGLVKWLNTLYENNFFEPSKFETSKAFLYLEKTAQELYNDFSSNKENLRKILAILNAFAQYVASEKINNIQAVCTRYFTVLITLPPEIFKEEDFEGINKVLDNEMYRLFIPDIQEFFIGLTSRNSASAIAGIKVILKSFTQYKEGYFANERFTSKIDIHSLEKLFNPAIISSLDLYPRKICCEILTERLEKISQSQGMEYPRLWRRAIEDHEQNRYLDEFPRFLIDTLRDILLGWLEKNPKDAKQYVMNLLKNKYYILKRIALFVVDKNFDQFKRSLSSIIQLEIFNRECFHELFHFLENHFNSFSKAAKKTTLKIINELSLEENEDVKIRFFYALKGHSDEARNFLEENSSLYLDAPDFLIYGTSRLGFLPNNSSYPVDTLIEFAKEKNIFQKINEFQDDVIILEICNNLEAAVRSEPLLFSSLNFIDAKHSYQYAYIKGLKEAWGGAIFPDELSKWTDILEKFFHFIKELLNKKFWRVSSAQRSIFGSLVPTIHWIPSTISDFLMLMTKLDEVSAPKEFLPVIYTAIKKLISHLPQSMDGNETDAMEKVINTSKGRAIDALVYFALHIKRLSIKSDYPEYSQGWRKIKQLLNNEVEKCKNSNFECSTLMGFYIENLNYLDSAWLQEHLMDIFPEKYNRNFYCAIQGLSYASVVTEVSYGLLRKRQVMERALRSDTFSKITKRHLLQRIALAYLEGWDDNAFEFLFKEKKVDELALVVNYFALREEPDVKKKEYVLKFFEYSMKCISSISDKKAKALLAVLPSLIYYLDSDLEKYFLPKLFPFTNLHIDNPYFRRSLDRLSEQHPSFVLRLMSEVLKTKAITHDSDGHILSIMKKCAKTKSKDKTFMDIMDKLKDLEGIQVLYKNIKRGFK